MIFRGLKRIKSAGFVYFLVYSYASAFAIACVNNNRTTKPFDANSVKKSETVVIPEIIDGPIDPNFSGDGSKELSQDIPITKMAKSSPRKVTNEPMATQTPNATPTPKGLDPSLAQLIRRRWKANQFVCDKKTMDRNGEGIKGVIPLVLDLANQRISVTEEPNLAFVPLNQETYTIENVINGTYSGKFSFSFATTTKSFEFRGKFSVENSSFTFTLEPGFLGCPVEAQFSYVLEN